MERITLAAITATPSGPPSLSYGRQDSARCACEVLARRGATPRLDRKSVVQGRGAAARSGGKADEEQEVVAVMTPRCRATRAVCREPPAKGWESPAARVRRRRPAQAWNALRWPPLQQLLQGRRLFHMAGKILLDVLAKFWHGDARHHV